MRLSCFLLLFFIYFHCTRAQHQCEKDFVKTTFINNGREINALLIWFPTNVGAQSSLRVCSEQTGLPLQRHCGYNRFNKTGVWAEMSGNIKLINCSSIPSLCMEEPFEHKYVLENGTTESFSNKWKTTKMTERGDLQEPCLKDSGVPLTRLCEYNRINRAAQWQLLSPDMRNVTCYRDEKFITYDLNSLYQELRTNNTEAKVEAKQAAKVLTELLATSQSVRVPADIKISTEILKIITEDPKSPELINEVLNFTDTIMKENEATMDKSEAVNASSSLLRTIDNYFHKMAVVQMPTNQCHNITDGIVLKTEKRTSVFYINPYCSNVTGLAIYKRKTHERQYFDKNTGYFYSFLYMNRTLDYIINAPDLLLASYFPLSLWNNMKNYLGSVDHNTVLTFILFKNDVLFVNHIKANERARKNILEIKISNYTGQLPEDIPFIYGFPKSSLEYDKLPKCGYWNYSSWSTVNVTTKYENISDQQLLICHSTHLTHLGAVFGLSFTDRILLSISHNLMLEYISVLGCGLSLVGLATIWLTALCLKSFRENPSSKVLLNMSFVLTLLMSFFIVSNLPQEWNPFTYENNILRCKITGAVLHYIVTVLFFWMLIIAFMQYLRYVKVIGYVLPAHYVLKVSVLAWGLPLIPVGYVAYEDGYTLKKEFGSKSTNICYPTDKSLKYGVILPTAAILLVNLVVFLCIFSSLRRSLAQFEHHARKYIINQVRISVLLFFLLGISWLFGILSFLYDSPVCSYIFCLTSTLQGFILFLFFIVFDQPTRLSWAIFCCGKSYNTKEGKSSAKYKNMNSRLNFIKATWFR